jgi:deazaflavin-dependent oxidoreductase (nitroreductase family)
MRPDPARLNRHWNCRITVRGRRTGEPRTTTVWFVAEPGRILLAGGKDDPQWCRNLRADGSITVQIGRDRFPGRARVVDDPAAARAIRDRFVGKYLLARLSRLFGGYQESVAVEVALDPAPDARSAS